MDIRLLRAFVTLSETQNFREAAEKLCITQPALTKQIKSLEQRLNVQLFIRNQKGALLSSSGTALLVRVKSIIEQHQLLIMEAAALNPQQLLSLNIGFGISAFSDASQLVTLFQQQHPSIDISLEDMPSSLMTQQLLAGTLQLAFMRIPQTNSLTHLVIKQETLAIAISASRYPKGSSLMELIATQPLLMLRDERGLGLNTIIRQFLKFNQIVNNSSHPSNDIQTLIAKVSAGAGIALVPASTRFITNDNVKILPLEGQYSQWPVGLVWNGEIAHKATEMFIQLAKQFYDLGHQPLDHL